jgi:thiol-disulfide isomerase/thioredoxin
MSEHFQGSEEEEQPESAMVPPSKIEYFQEDEEEQGPEHFQNEEEEDNGIEYFQSPEEEYGMTQENFQDDDEEVEPFYSGNYNTFNGQVSLESDQHAEYFTNYSDTVEHMSNGPSSRPVVLKLFYADWCGHCQRFKPVFENQLPTAIKQSGLNCKLQAVNADKSPEMVNKYKVQGFPTLILEGADGKTVEYMGDRSAGDIVNFVASNNI